MEPHNQSEKGIDPRFAELLRLVASGEAEKAQELLRQIEEKNPSIRVLRDGI